MLCLLLDGNKKKRNGQGDFFPGLDMLFWLCHTGFSWLLGAIKG
jgi:hypothetical protein